MAHEPEIDHNSTAASAGRGLRRGRNRPLAAVVMGALLAVLGIVGVGAPTTALAAGDIEFVDPVTDNYKVMIGDRPGPDNRTSFLFTGVRVGATTYVVPQAVRDTGNASGAPQLLGEAPVGMPLATSVGGPVVAYLSYEHTGMNAWNYYRLWNTGTFGPLITVNRPAFVADPHPAVTISFTLRDTADQIIGTRQITYRYDAQIAALPDTSPEWNGPLGRFHVGAGTGTPTPLNWPAGTGISSSPTGPHQANLSVPANQAATIYVAATDIAGLAVPRFQTSSSDSAPKPVTLTWAVPGDGKPTSATPEAGWRPVNINLPVGTHNLTASGQCDDYCRYDWQTVALASATSQIVAVGAGTPSDYVRPVPEVPIQPCSRYAAPDGNDANPGTAAQPVKNIRTLTLKLSPGQTGCLKNDSTITLDAGGRGIMFGGAAGAPKVIRPETPGKRATVLGPNGFLIDHDQSDLIFKDIDFRKTTNTSGSLFRVDGDRVMLDGVDLTYAYNICLDVGGDARNGEWHRTAHDFVLIDSRIHDCGSAYLTNPDYVTQGWHGAYLQLIRDGDGDGKGAIIYNSLFDVNKDRGIQLYSDADDVHIDRVVMYGNGTNFNVGADTGDGEVAASRPDRARVTNSILANARYVPYNPANPGYSNTADVVGYFPGTTGGGADNRIIDSCLSNTIDNSHLFEVSGTEPKGLQLQDVTLNQPPTFANAAGRDFRLTAGSSCQGKGLADASRLPGASTGGPAGPGGTPSGPADPGGPTPRVVIGTVDYAGSLKIGATLRARVGGVKPSGVKFTYQWRRGSKVIAGATRATYKVKLADVGRRITVRVTGTRAGHANAVKSFTRTGSVPRPRVTVKKVRYVGTLRVGRRLAASVRGVTPRNAKVRYQWYRDGKGIKGATKKSYMVRSADRGKRITLRATIAKTKYVSATGKYRKAGRVQ